MDEFVQSLHRDQVPEWSQHYLAYEDLQNQVEAAAAGSGNDETADQRQKDVQGRPRPLHDEALRAKFTPDACSVCSLTGKRD